MIKLIQFKQNRFFQEIFKKLSPLMYLPHAMLFRKKTDLSKYNLEKSTHLYNTYRQTI